jgi:hypothetical protein
MKKYQLMEGCLMSVDTAQVTQINAIYVASIIIMPTSLIIAASVVTQGRKKLICDWNPCGSKRSLQPLDMVAVICKNISGLKMHIILGINYESTQWSILYLDTSPKAMFDALSLCLKRK